MRYVFIALLILLMSSKILPQELSKVELDSLYNLFTFIKGINASDKLQKQLQENPEITKCGMELVYTHQPKLK